MSKFHSPFPGLVAGGSALEALERFQASASSATHRRCCLIRTLQLCFAPATGLPRAATYRCWVLRPCGGSRCSLVGIFLPFGLFFRKTRNQRTLRGWFCALQTDSSMRDRQPSLYSALDPDALRRNHLQRNGILSCSNSSKMGQLDGTALSCPGEIPSWLKAPSNPTFI